MKFYFITILTFLYSFWVFAQDEAISEGIDQPDFLKTVQMDLATMNSEKGEGVSLFFKITGIKIICSPIPIEKKLKGFMVKWWNKI